MTAKNSKNVTIFSEKHFKFFLHYPKAEDIKSIDKINVLEMGPRHCSTTFYQ